jgi:hypothetical protein
LKSVLEREEEFEKQLAYVQVLRLQMRKSQVYWDLGCLKKNNKVYL